MDRTLKFDAATYSRFAQLVTPMMDANRVLNELMDLANIPPTPDSTSGGHQGLGAPPPGGHGGRGTRPVRPTVALERTTADLPVPVNISNLPPARTKPGKVVVLGVERKAWIWKDVIVAVAEILIERGELLGEVRGKSGRRVLVADTEIGMIDARQLSNGSYVETNWSARDTVSRACQLLEAGGLSEDDLTVWLDTAR